MEEQKFELGKIICTKAVFNLTHENHEFARFMRDAFVRFKSGDWGDLCPSDCKQNEEALKTGEARLMGSYPFPANPSWYVDREDKLWIITEWDRSVTTLLFPGEY